MIKTIKYYVVNGDKSEPFALEKELQNEKELEQLRSELEEKHHCFETVNIPGRPSETKRVKVIIIYFYPSVPKDYVTELK